MEIGSARRGDAARIWMLRFTSNWLPQNAHFSAPPAGERMQKFSPFPEKMRHALPVNMVRRGFIRHALGEKRASSSMSEDGVSSSRSSRGRKAGPACPCQAAERGRRAISTNHLNVNYRLVGGSPHAELVGWLLSSERECWLREERIILPAEERKRSEFPALPKGSRREIADKFVLWARFRRLRNSIRTENESPSIAILRRQPPRGFKKKELLRQFRGSISGAARRSGVVPRRFFVGRRSRPCRIGALSAKEKPRVAAVARGLEEKHSSSLRGLRATETETETETTMAAGRVRVMIVVLGVAGLAAPVCHVEKGKSLRVG